jgi:hypothetical protein
MSTSGFDSPPTPSKDMSEVVELNNNIYTLVDGATTMPNNELSKCSN